MIQVYFRLMKRLCTAFFPLLLLGCIQPVQPETNTVSIEPILIAMDPEVQVDSPLDSTTSLQKDQTIPIKINDLMTAGTLGRGLVRIEDRVMVNLFRESEFRITEIKPEASNFLFIELEHVKGHIRVQLSQNANAKVRLITSIATVTTLRAGTEFVICHNPLTLSCIVALEGEVEVVGQGKVVTIKGGEATYVLKDQSPFDPICAHRDEVDNWINEKNGTGVVDPISKLVSSWNPEPCSVATQNAAVEVRDTLPSSVGMVYIGAGPYAIGSANPGESQIPLKKITLPAYWIDQYEVTNSQYQVFMNETGHSPPSVWPGGESNPVAGVSWNDANAYCTWAGKRLPSEAEWEVAARGSGDNPPLFPWGNDTQAGGKIFELPLNTTYPVGAYSFNQSAFGVFDMAGNVWEWVGEPYANVADYHQVLRGGRYGFIQDMAHREQVEANNERFIAVAGFRCAADQVEGE